MCFVLAGWDIRQPAGHDEMGQGEVEMKCLE